MAKELIPDRPQEKLKTAFEYQVDSAAGIIRKLEEKVTLAFKRAFSNQKARPTFTSCRSSYNFVFS